MAIEFTAVLVAVIGALASSVTFSYGKYHENKVELRKIKEQQYIDFLTYLAKAKTTADVTKEQAEQELSIKIQTIYLVGNKKVQQSLKDFWSALKILI